MTTISLFDYFTQFVNNVEKQEAIQLYSLQPSTIQTIQTLLEKTPQMFQELSHEISIIVEKGSINVHDIIPIVITMKDIYNKNITTLKTPITIIQGLDFIETVLILLIHENIIPIDVANRYAYIYIIETSIDLLESTIEGKNNSFLKKICCCFFKQKEEDVITPTRRRYSVV